MGLFQKKIGPVFLKEDSDSKEVIEKLQMLSTKASGELKRECADKKVLVVSHGGVCRIIHNYFIDMENEEFVRFAFPNCGIEEYEL